MTNLVRFTNQLKIVDKDLGVRRLGTCITPAQYALRARVEEDLVARRPVRHIILKARQMGFSTFVQATMFWMAFMRPKLRGLVIAHRKDSAEHLLTINKHFWDTAWFRQAYTEKYAATNKLAWQETDSLLTVTTASSIGASRGKTIQFLHGSEVGFWRDPDTLITGLAPSIPRRPLTCIFLESTANGVGNWFHQTWKASVAGDLEYRPLFYPWFLHPEYRASMIGEGHLLSRPMVFLDDEERVLYKFFRKRGFDSTESHDMILWRRLILATECHNDINKFHQEYPTTADEAFISSGRNIFPLEQLRMVYEPENPDRGELVVNATTNRVTFVKNPRGPLAIYRYPSKDRGVGVYLAGGDPAWSATGDYSCVQVINRRTWEQCAVFRDKVDAHTLGRQMMLLGRWYNDAILAPEATKAGGAAVEYLRVKEYPHIWLHKKAGRLKGQADETLGWVTNSQTKHEAIGNLQSVIFEAAQPQNYNLGTGILLHDEHTYTELKEYVDLGGGKFGNSADTEHDDTVMALAIAMTCILYEASNLHTASSSPHAAPLSPESEEVYAQLRVPAAAAMTENPDPSIDTPLYIPSGPAPWLDINEAERFFDHD